ncbi:MAG: hypothetical protein EOP53_16860, partial [Sphingobacteriales bacterium]
YEMLFAYNDSGEIVARQVTIVDLNSGLLSKDKKVFVESYLYGPDGTLLYKRDPFGVESRLRLGQNQLMVGADLRLPWAPDVWEPIITSMQYNPKGQIQGIDYRKGLFTRIEYEPETLLMSRIKSYRDSRLELQDLSLDFDGLDKLKADFDKANLQIQGKHNEIKKLLNGQKLADLEKEVSAIEKPHITESPEMLQAQFNEMQKQLAEYQTIERYASKQLQDWEMKFGSKENLLDKLLENKAELSNVENQISQLKSLPENIADSQEFLDEFNRKMAALDKTQNQMILLREKRADLNASQPEDSTEDLTDKLTQAKSKFEHVLRKGKAYKRIQTELNTILEELDKYTFTPLKSKTEEYFHKLTGGKYQTLRMEETVPADIELNGAWLPASLLSTGTLDLLALATRLAMADFYLEDKSGFIVLDDPLVNLDPQRQEMAAKCLREIAAEKQVIILTCHPSHAAMLQGDLIEL